MTDNSIPVARFARLMHEADAAVKANDLTTVERINAEIEMIGYRVIVRDGQAKVQQLYFNPETGRYELPAPKP
jgi:hypothetical protein